ncbi:poly-gamma-glutamate synthase PgsB [Alkalicoccus halolimnae]|uniref:poly-gamma-glutamate synthase PgsB n=1 Tax=Alkalicoccus halolimnae TaxID=1667239 RepID=UPI003BAFEB60
MIVTAVIFAVILFLGVRERKKHAKALEKVPVRINVNGVRGKSTVTRLVTGILQEAGYRTVGKTTGTDARMLYWFEDEETPIKRRLEGPNIGEQKKVIQTSADKKADALVSECMAVNPDYQEVFQEEMLQANIVLIVNVLHDHMEVLGPTLDHVAEAFAGTIPYNGHLIINESPYVEYYTKIAEERKSTVKVIEADNVTEAYLKKFPYMVFPENAALGFAVAEALGIDRAVAEKGMLQAWPDPGSMKILTVGDTKEPSHFVNGFAANDATSTINIWKRVEQLGFPVQDPVIIVNCREDRVERTEQFASDVLPYLPTANLVLIGSVTDPIVKACHAGTIKAGQVLDLADKNIEEVVEELQPFLKNRTIYGIGNIHGMGEPLIHEFEEMMKKRDEQELETEKLAEVQ